MAATVGACGLLNSVESGTYLPVTAGVVLAVVPLEAETRFELGDGQIVTVTSTTQYIGATSPQVGELLLAGSEPERWIYRARPVGPIPDVPSPICYEVIGDTRADATHILKTVHDAARGDLIIAFPKAEGWADLGSLETRDALLGDVTCLNERGEAFEQRIGR